MSLHFLLLTPSYNLSKSSSRQFTPSWVKLEILASTIIFRTAARMMEQRTFWQNGSDSHPAPIFRNFAERFCLLIQ
jgi:hypothetical protein